MLDVPVCVRTCVDFGFFAIVFRMENFRVIFVVDRRAGFLLKDNLTDHLPSSVGKTRDIFFSLF